MHPIWIPHVAAPSHEARVEEAWNLLHLIPAREKERLRRGWGRGLTIVSTGSVRSSSTRLASLPHLTDEVH